MAVKVKGAGVDQSQAQGQGQTAGTQQPNQPQQKANPFVPMFGISSGLVSGGSGGEQLEKLYENLTKKAEEANKVRDAKFSIVKVLKQNRGINYSAIALCETLNGLTSAHILIIEKTGDYPEKLVENISGIRYEITRTPADALDDKYVFQVRNAITTALRISDNDLVIVDGTLVPNEFDVNSEAQIDALIRNASNAVQAENMIRVKDYKGFNIANILVAAQNGKFFINTYFNGDRTSLLDQSGMPIRQDICVALSFKANQNTNNKSVNQGNDSVDIVKTYGYIDFEYVVRLWSVE